MKPRLAGLASGALFAFAISWARLTEYDTIHDMLLLRELDVFFLMGAAMATATVGARLLRGLGARTLADGSPVAWTVSKPTRDTVVGSVLFGLGWSLAGTCPGPVAAQIGQGKLAGLLTAGGILLGVALRGAVIERAAKAAAAPQPQAACTPGL